MVDIYLIAFIKRGKNRSKILQLLSENDKTQAELHSKSKMYRTHVRRTLIELQNRKLVKCLNPKDRIHKIYQITNLGEKVLDEIKQVY